MWSALICSTLIYAVNAAVEKDRMDSLPGYTGELPSTHYSGYLPVGELSGVNGQLHYWLIESRASPSTDPVVLWLNGGPGSSSLFGLLTENGQLLTNDFSLEDPVDGVPQLFFNPYSWDGHSNMLYLESPKGVGFSYCEDATSSEECVNDDTSTAQDAYEFLVRFFEAFPEYKGRDFFIAGESYAGIYIPLLIEQLEQDPLNAGIIKHFKGAAIGNGCWANTVGICAATSPETMHILSEFFYGHGMYSHVLKKEIGEACGDFNHLFPECLSKLNDMRKQVGKFDVYNIYARCGLDYRRKLESVVETETEDLTSFSSLRDAFAKKAMIVETSESFHVALGEEMNDFVCGASRAMDVWLAEDSVIKALHVKPDTPGMKYVKTATDLTPLYSRLIENYQLLIYSGDVDACVPYVGSEAWTRSLNFTVIDDWHQWLSKPDMEHRPHKAGYAVTFDKFQFITISGAGHMVPQYQPAFALTMFEKFLMNDKF